MSDYDENNDAARGIVTGGSQGTVDGGSQGVGYPSTGSDSGYGYGYGYGGGGGYSGKTPEETQEETQAQINNTTANYLNRAGDLNDLGKQNLKNISDQAKQNTKLYQSTRRQNMKQVEWQPNQQKEQSTLQALRSRMGNAAYGSSNIDLMEGLSRVDDMNDVNLINAWKQNEDTAYNNWFQANEDLVADYIDQMTAIQDEFSKLYSQYWSTMSNINPLLVTKENMEKAKNGEEVSVGEDTDAYTLPSIQGMGADEALRKMFGKYASTSEGSENTNSDNQVADSLKFNLGDIASSIRDSANNRLSSGSGFNSLINAAKAVDQLIDVPQRANGVNPYTRRYVRPDRAVNAANAIGNTGSVNRAPVASLGQQNNIGAYQRRV